MAATVDLGQQLQFENVKHLPPRAPSGRPCSGEFHNRGRLFSTKKQQPESDNTPSQCVLAADSLIAQADSDKPTAFSSPKKRTVQTANPRCVAKNACSPENPYPDACQTVAIPGNDLAVYDVNTNLVIERKPPRHKYRDGPACLNVFSHHISVDHPAIRPSSAKNQGPISKASEPENGEQTPEELKPSVFGYRLKRQVFGSNPDIFTSDLQAVPPTTMFKLDDTHENRPKGDTQPNTADSSRSIPAHMEPLRPWLHQNISQEAIGVDPSTCLVFLPLNQTYDDLPVVPLS